MGPNREEYKRLVAMRDAARIEFKNHLAEVQDASEQTRDDLRVVAADHPFASAAVVAASTFLIARLLNRSVLVSMATLGLGVLRAEGVSALTTRFAGNGQFDGLH